MVPQAPRLGMAGSQQPDQDWEGMGSSLGSLFGAGRGQGAVATGMSQPDLGHSGNMGGMQLAKGGGLDVMGSIENINQDVRRSVKNPMSGYGD